MEYGFGMLHCGWLANHGVGYNTQREPTWIDYKSFNKMYKLNCIVKTSGWPNWCDASKMNNPKIN